MDWGSKMAAWDLAELEPNAEPNLRKSRAKADEMDCRVDLKLGGSDDLGAPETWRDQPPISIEISSSSPSKRARAPSSGGGCYNASCLVDGCKADLSACREYHRRHKVCEMHSKTPVVVVGGVEQRFCQQCSRFHLLVEFDEVKRSCRKRLDGHNRRRRKPQPDSISSANLFLIQQGARFSTYSLASQTPPVQHNWAGILKEEDDAPFSFSSPISSTSNQQHVPGSFFQRYKEGEPITLIQDNKTVCGAAVEQSTYQPSLKTLSSEISQSRIFSDGINLDSDCALSLLSSPADGIPMGQPYVLNFQYSRLEQYPVSQASRNLLPTESSSGLQEEQVGVLVCDTDADLQCQSMFHVGGTKASSIKWISPPISDCDGASGELL